MAGRSRRASSAELDTAAVSSLTIKKFKKFDDENNVVNSESDDKLSNFLNSEFSMLDSDHIESNAMKLTTAGPSNGNDEPEQNSLMGEHALYQELSVIGNGAYGTVYKAKDLTNGQVVALKKLRLHLTEDGLPTSTLREIATLKQLERFEHVNIVS